MKNYNETQRSRIMVAYLMIGLLVSMSTVLFLPHLWRESREVWEILHAPIPFDEIYSPSENLGEGVNDVRGVVLHHTATSNITQSLNGLTKKRKSGNVSCHLLVDLDGTRYVLANPEDITWHAGPSRLNGRDNANEFTIGIEFQGNTLEKPLTQAQIESAIDYLIPILEQYKIPKENIVTHEFIRKEYKMKYPKRKVSAKVDVVPEEHERFMHRLEERISAHERMSNARNYR